MTSADKGPKILDLKEGQHLVGFYLARDPRLETFRDPSRGTYLRLLLADRSGQMEARVWEQAEEAAAAIEKSRIVKIEGDVESYRDQLQIKVARLRAAPADEIDPAELIPTTQREIPMMWQDLDRRIEQLENRHLSALARHFFDNMAFRQRFAEVPAAQRIHHAYRGGLLEHVYEVLQLSDALLELYPEIDRDLLTVGILLHDIGKLKELESAVDPAYTDQGQLIGHLALGAAAVAEAMNAIDGFPEELGWQVHHLLLSHHGRREWGSPRVPKTLEAIALHHLEHLDGEVNRFRSLLAEARGRGDRWTPYERSLGRSLFAGDSEQSDPS